MPSLRERLRHVSEANRTLLCVGLDPDPASMAVQDVADFNRAIVDATADLVCAFKPNLAFYEALGSAGIVALERTVDPHTREGARRGRHRGRQARRHGVVERPLRTGAVRDVGIRRCDGERLPQGGEALEPFLSYEDKGVFVLCKTSNPGARELQDIGLASGRRLFEEVACRAAGVEHERQRRPRRGRDLSGRPGDSARALPRHAGASSRHRSPGGRSRDLGEGWRRWGWSGSGRKQLARRDLRFAGTRGLRGSRPEGPPWSCAGRISRRAGEARQGVVIDFRMGDRVVMKKAHPCGAYEWEVVQGGRRHRPAVLRVPTAQGTDAPVRAGKAPEIGRAETPCVAGSRASGAALAAMGLSEDRTRLRQSR